MNNTKKTSMGAIPVASPYYDRLLSLHIQMESLPLDSPEYHCFVEQIRELERRVQQRRMMDAMLNNRED